MMWKRYANPWGAWTRLLTYPLIVLAFWHESYFWVILLLAYLVFSPGLFPPFRKEGWITQATMGEYLYLRHKKHKWWVLTYAIVEILLFLGAIYVAAMQHFISTIVLLTVLLGSKLIILQIMVNYYRNYRR